MTIDSNLAKVDEVMTALYDIFDPEIGMSIVDLDLIKAVEIGSGDTPTDIKMVLTTPFSPWAGELQGTTVEGGSAANPLKARWMGIANGVGIHGTGEDYSIGTRASHGCIRMHVADVIDLFKRVPVGTPGSARWWRDGA